MPLTSPTLSNVVFRATVQPQVLQPFSESLPLQIPINFDSVSNLKVLVGSYTPNNDYIYLLSGIPSGESPNFMIIMIDAPIALSCQFPKGALNYSPTKFAFLEWVVDPLNLLTGCFIDGRLSPNPGNTPMTQGKTVSYTIICGQSMIS